MKLLEQHDRAFEVELETDEAITEALASFETALEGLRAKIGYDAVCSECLYEKTGLDLRRKPSS
jgi:hypothetical protein